MNGLIAIKRDRPARIPYRQCFNFYCLPKPSVTQIDPQLQPLTRTQLLIAMGVTAVLLGLLAKLWLQFGDVALLPLRWNVATLPFAMAIAAIVTTISSLMYQFWAAYRNSADFYLEFVLKPLVLPDLIWVGLLPGLSEELLFRGVMLPAFGTDTTGIAVSSLCFGILHLSNCKQWQYVVWATIVGFILGYSAVITNNLLVPIIAHVLINLISSSIWKLKHPQSQTE
jgi:hypothetical protein